MTGSNSLVEMFLEVSIFFIISIVVLFAICLRVNSHNPAPLIPVVLVVQVLLSILTFGCPAITIAHS